MPCDWSKYPDNWREIRARVLARAGNKCENCGAPNGETVYRDFRSILWWRDDEPDQEEDYRLVHVVLTVAHLDHDTTHNDLENLKAWCQRCHLRYDAQQHARNARNTRRNRRAVGDLL